MPSAPQPASALRDRAERHVFALLPELGAVERRVLALLELTDAGRAAAAADTGLDDTALRFAAKRARKDLRRGSAPLAAGARCERAELLLSDRLDAPLARQERKWLEIHQARCPRCAEHATLLATARDELRASFVAEPPPAPAPPPAPEPRAKLRVVPVPVPDPAPLGGETRLTDEKDGPTVAAPPAPPTPAPPKTPAPAAVQPRRAPSPAIKKAARVLAILLVLAGLVAGAIAAAGAIDTDSAPPRAPWDAPSAPDIRPAPLTDQ